jgi:hypothetical protein
MQHVLNDRSFKESFLKLNRQFAPHVVVFNSEEWTPGSYTEFQGNAFHHLIGACDFHIFAAAARAADGTWILGGQTRKNAAALIAALRQLPEKFRMRLFGPTEALPAGSEDLVKSGRLELPGPLWGAELAEYYHGIDCFVSPEMTAGWSNASAEAMASGVPIICTRHGTASFAEDGVSAIELKTADAEEIAAAVTRLEASPELARTLATAGRVSIARFGWDAYCDQLLALCRRGREQAYFRLPELGLYGKWPAEERLKGLEPALSAAGGRTVLDLGAAEGWIAFQMLKAGAKSVHGCELDAARVEAANRLCADFPGSRFWQADLTDWKGMLDRAGDGMLKSYGIVLYLGVHQHLGKESRMTALLGAVDLANEMFAIRTSSALLTEDGVEQALEARGWRLISSTPDETETRLGATRIFQRAKREGGDAA